MSIGTCQSIITGAIQVASGVNRTSTLAAGASLHFQLVCQHTGALYQQLLVALKL